MAVPKRRRRLLMVVALTITAVASLASTASSRAARPNVLLIVTDDQRANGTMGVMPETRAFFGDRGRTYTNAVATTPTCCPSRATILGGRYAHNHGVLHTVGNEAELAQLDTEAMLANQLSQAGYRTGLVGKYLNGWPLQQPPPDFDRFAMSYGAFFDTRWNVNGSERDVSRYSTSYVGSQTRQMIRGWEQRDKRPWFMYVAPFAAHATIGPSGGSFEPEPKYEDAKVGRLRPNPARNESSARALADKPPFWRQLIADYEPGPGQPSAAETRAGQLRMLMSVDDMVAGISKELRKRGESRRTLAIFVSDQGFFWGEHGAPPAKDMPYRDSVDTPLLARWPGHLDGGSRDGRLAATIDLAPTILDAARAGAVPRMDGRSLLRSWDRDHVLLEYASSGKVPTWRSIYDPRREQYTEYLGADGEVDFREYYDLRRDPWQLGNRLGNGDTGDDRNVARLARELEAARRCAGRSCP